MALPNNNINVGAPPLLWSNMKEALDKINDNFIALDLATGGTAVDLSILNTDVSPEYTDQYALGSNTNQWKSVHSAAWSDTLSGSLNGLWAGQAQIKGYEKDVDTGYGPLPRWIIDLPVGSTVDGQLIIDPDKTFIKTIQVDGNKSLESTVYGFTANFVSGLGIGLTVTSASDEIEFAVDPTFDLNGSILADDTSVLVDRAGYIRGNVNTTTDWSATVNGNTWLFKDTGVLQFPGSATFGQTTGKDVLSSGPVKDLVLSTDQSVKIITDADAGVVTWSFNESGEFVVPGPISLEYSGTPIIGISTTTTSGRIIGETNKTFSIVLTDGTNPKDWTFDTYGKITFPDSTVFGEVEGTGTVGFASKLDSSFLIETSNVSTGYVWDFDHNGGLTIPSPGVIRNSDTGSVNIVSSNFAQLQWTTQTGAHEADPNNTSELINWFYIESGGAFLETNLNDGINPSNSWYFDLNGITHFPAGQTVEADGFHGDVTGNLTGDVSGNLTGDVTGNVSGNAGTVTNGVYTTGSYSDPSWLTISKTKVGLSNVENTALSTWAGSTNITTVGTLGSLSVTNNVGAGSFTGNIFTSLIDSADSSAITVTPAVVFSSDISVENELTVGGSRVINLAQLKSIVAASTTWGDFQAAIAAL